MLLHGIFVILFGSHPYPFILNPCAQASSNIWNEEESKIEVCEIVQLLLPSIPLKVSDPSIGAGTCLDNSGKVFEKMSADLSATPEDCVNSCNENFDSFKVRGVGVEHFSNEQCFCLLNNKDSEYGVGQPVSAGDDQGAACYALETMVITERLTNVTIDFI